MNKTELEKMHANFVRVCGGRPISKLTPNQTSSTGDENSFKKTSSVYETTKKLVLQKFDLQKTAKEKNVTTGTIVSHLEKLVETKQLDPSRDLSHIRLDPDQFEEIKKALKMVSKKETKILSLTRTLLKDKYSYEEIRVARLFIKD